jgi:acyl-coenzyme A thioesterase PaaI-like protein
MVNPTQFIEKAKHSNFHLWVLNFALNRIIPFNKAHDFNIEKVGNRYVKTKLPFQKSNLNHIKGLHACALATLSEFSTGIVLLSSLDPKKYRIILKKLEMDYHYQGKMDAFAEFELSEEWLNSKVIEPLQNLDAVDVVCVVKIYDKSGNHLTTGNVNWQIKDWTKVKTKLN